MPNPTILGIGVDIPSTVLTNEELAEDLLLERELLLDPSKEIPKTLFKSGNVPKQIASIRQHRSNAAVGHAVMPFIEKFVWKNLPQRLMINPLDSPASDVISPDDIAGLLQDLADAKLELGVPMSSAQRKQFETSDEWIVQRTGIRERRVANDNEAASDLAARAVRKALKAAGKSTSDIGFLLVATVTGDFLASPPCASVTAEKAGIRAVNDEGIRDFFVLDGQAACSSFAQMFRLGCSLIQAGHYECGVVVGVDIMTRLANWFDRSMCVLFGDAAAACVLGQAKEGSGIRPQDFHSGSMGQYADLIKIRAGGSHLVCVDPAVILNPFGQLTKLEMDGRAVYEIIVPFVSERLLPEALKRAGV